MTRELTCICCPKGCTLHVSGEGEDLQVTGNACPRGESYAREEVAQPLRIVTAVVATDSEDVPFVPVRTDRPLPREQVFPLLRALYAMRLSTPLAAGSRILENFKDSGVHVITSRAVPPA